MGDDPLLTTKARLKAALQQIDGVLRQIRQVTQDAEESNPQVPLPQKAPDPDSDIPKPKG
jgi:hypothetical protein